MTKCNLIRPVVVALLLASTSMAARQAPAVRTLDETVLREYAGVYEWGPNAFVYLQLWSEFEGTNHLVAFDESGEVRTLYPTDHDDFFAGPGAAVSTRVESRVAFQRNSDGSISSMTWQRGSAMARIARRVDIEARRDVAFDNGKVRLAGTLVAPRVGGPHPAVILVHGSGSQNRETVLPFARFLVRHGMAVFGYDKRGVGGSTGDWNTASFDDLAGDVVAAFEYLKTRPDIDRTQIGLMGVSQAGWIMPLAAVRAPGIAFLISVSGPGVPAAETTIDHQRNELLASGMAEEHVEVFVSTMRLAFHFARTREGWDAYAKALEALSARLGAPPPAAFPRTPDHPFWVFSRRLFFYDPVPTLRRLQVPTLALFAELDNNVLAEKNKTAWDAALRVGGNRDFTSLTLESANHIQLEAQIGNTSEMRTLQRFVPVYFSTVRDWLAERVRGFAEAR